MVQRPIGQTESWFVCRRWSVAIGGAWRAGRLIIATAVASLMFIDGVLVDDGTPDIEPAPSCGSAASTSKHAAIRLVIKSKRRLVRDAIVAYLAGQAEFAVVGQTGTVDALAELCRLRRPDVALVDAMQLNAQTVENLLRVRAAAPAVELVVAYAEATPRALETAAGAGITALIPCNGGLEAVLRRVREGAHANDRRPPDGVALTDYDIRILRLVSSGYSAAEMAKLLRVSTHTVDNHKRRLYEKLDVHNSSHAVAVAAALGLIEAPGSDGQARVAEPGRRPLAVVQGSTGASLDEVVRTLLDAEIPFVQLRTLAPLDQEHWVRWYRGPIVAVLIDPAYNDWFVPAGVADHTVVVISADPDLATCADLLLRGAHALVRGRDVRDDLAAVLSVVARGYLAVDARCLDDVTGQMTVRLADAGKTVPGLTARERDVLSLVADGHTIRQTAQLLGIAAKTVENIQSRLYRKLGARNRTEALTIALRLGLLDMRPLLTRAP
jgi:two-component system, NarL family, nitrate/nitrite response regulator NarL